MPSALSRPLITVIGCDGERQRFCSSDEYASDFVSTYEGENLFNLKQLKPSYNFYE